MQPSLFGCHILSISGRLCSHCVTPFLFNPHQFSFADYIIDYCKFLRWMSCGNSRFHLNSWIRYCRLSRMNIIGYKQKHLGHPSEELSADIPCAGGQTILMAEIILICSGALFVIAYMFVKSIPGTNDNIASLPLICIAVVALCPIIWNATVLIVMFMVSVFMGPFLTGCCISFGSVMAFICPFPHSKRRSVLVWGSRC